MPGVAGGEALAPIGTGGVPGVHGRFGMSAGLPLAALATAWPARSCSGRVIETFRAFAHDATANETLDRAQRVTVFRSHKADGVSHRVGATGPANAVDIILPVHREVVINN